MVQRFGNAHDAMRLADHIADTGHVLDLAPDGEGEPVIAVDRRRRDERPEIPVDLGLDLRLDRLDRGHDDHIVIMVVLVRGCQRLAVFADRVELEHHQIGVVVAHRRHRTFNEIALDHVIGIDEVDIVASGLRQSDIARIGQAAIGLVDHADPLIPRRPRIAHRRAAVGRPVVDEQDLKIAVRLADQSLHARVEIPLDSVHRHDDRPERRGPVTIHGLRRHIRRCFRFR